MMCSNCNFNSQDDNLFCANCGSNLVKDIQENNNNFLQNKVDNSNLQNNKKKLLLVVIVLASILIILIIYFLLKNNSKNNNSQILNSTQFNDNIEKKEGLANGKCIVTLKKADKDDNKYYITDCNEKIYLASSWQIIYSSKHELYLLYNVIYDKDFKQITPSKISSDDYIWEPPGDYFSYYNTSGVVIDYTGKEIGTYPNDNISYFYIDYSQDLAIGLTQYAVISFGGEKSAIINCATGKIVYDYIESTILSNGNNIFEIESDSVPNEYTSIYIQNDEIVMEDKSLYFQNNKVCSNDKCYDVKTGILENK